MRTRSVPARPLAGLWMALALGCSAASASARTAPPAWGPRPQATQDEVDTDMIRGPVDRVLGTVLPDFPLVELARGPFRLSSEMGANGLLLAVRDPECPICMKYSPKLRRMEDELARRGIGLVYVNPFGRELAREDVETHGFAAPYGLDDKEALLQHLGARSTTEVFLLDEARTVRYRGAIDDQYAFGQSLEEPRETWLLDALADLEEGRDVAVPETEAPGCFLAIGQAQRRDEFPITWHGDIRPILAARCETCHRAGTDAPFPLHDLGDLQRRRGMLTFVLESEHMPPWKTPANSGPWANDRGLTPEERGDFLAWLQNGLPEGEPTAVADPAPAFPPLGAADLVWAPEEPLAIPAEGPVGMHTLTFWTSFRDTRWIEAVELVLGGPEVRSATLWIEAPGELKAAMAGGVAARDKVRGSYLASAVSGVTTVRYPEGHARKLPPRSWLKLDVQYVPDGSAGTAKPEVRLHFAERRPSREVRVDAAVNYDFELPPGERFATAAGEFRFDRPGRLMTLFPLTHVRGKSFRYDLVRADGRIENLLWLHHYTHRWPWRYEFAEPLDVRAGDRLRATAWYDNSADHPGNPDPEATVKVGEALEAARFLAAFEWST